MTGLAHSLVTAPAAEPERFVLVLHGILGSRSNWRSLARKLVKARPEWGACLVDLRMHGDSQPGFEPPHTVAAAAEDLTALDDVLPKRPTAILGHSFGGKVALAYARGRDDLTSLVIVDSMPGPRPGGRGSEGTIAVVEMLRELPRRWDSRKDFVAAVVARGHVVGLAQWLAMNLEAEGEHYALRLDLDAIGALLDDYFAIDLWPVLEAPVEHARVSIVVGGASTVYDAADLARAGEIAGSREATTLEVIDGAGHWVHVEAPEALLAAWQRALPG